MPTALLRGGRCIFDLSGPLTTAKSPKDERGTIVSEGGIEALVCLDADRSANTSPLQIGLQSQLSRSPAEVQAGGPPNVKWLLSCPADKLASVKPALDSWRQAKAKGVTATLKFDPKLPKIRPRTGTPQQTSRVGSVRNHGSNVQIQPTHVRGATPRQKSQYSRTPKQ